MTRSSRVRTGWPRMGRGFGPTGWWVGLVAALASGCVGGGATADDPLVVGAASHLMDVFVELGDVYEDATGDEVAFTFASSGQLAQQLREGAPMDVYASADAGYVDTVLDAGIGAAGTRTTFGRGRIVLWTPRTTLAWRDLTALAADPDVASVAIANPEHAPYGRAAREALRSVGAWEALEDRLVFGENIADAQRLAASGNADAAITALALVLGASGDTAWALIDADAHAPLRQELLVVTGDETRAERARAFVDTVTGPDAEPILHRYGLRGEIAAPADPGTAASEPRTATGAS